MQEHNKRPQGTAFINQPISSLAKVDGFTVERDRTRAKSAPMFDKNTDKLIGFFAWPVKGLPDITREMYPIHHWTLSIVPDNCITEPGFRQQVIVCTPDCKALYPKSTDIMVKENEKVNGKEVYVKYTRLFGIRGDVVVVTAIFGKDCDPAWFVDVHKLVNPEPTKIWYRLETHKWDFPVELITLGTTGQIPSKEKIIEIILKDVEECMDDRKKAFLKTMAPAMGALYQRIFGRSASLPKPEATPAPAPKLEAKATPAPEAPAPAAQATEEPATPPTADEPAPEVSDQEAEGKKFEPAQLNLVPDQAPEPELTDGQDIAGQQVNPDRKGTGRTRNPKSAKGKKVKGAKTGTDGE